MPLKTEIISQFITQVLIPRLNRADQIFQNGNPYRAVQAQKSIINTLDRTSPEKRDKFIKWIEEIDAIDDDIEPEAYTRHAMEYERAKIRNQKAYKLYEKIDWEIWGLLHELGYFIPSKRYGPDLKEISEEGEVKL